MYRQTTTLRKIQAIKSTVKVIQGSSSAGKTVAILLILINLAQSKNAGIISVVSETLPHLKKGAIRDFLSIMNEHHYFKDSLWNKTNNTYTFETGTILEFFSADTPDKVKGPRRQVLFINEANNISLATYSQLEIRTEGDIYIDFNPVAEFWAHTSLNNSELIIVTYKDNEGLSKSSIEKLEAHKGNKQFWRVYGLGLIGEAEERIYKGWRIIDEIPFEAQLVRRWLDYGYAKDPTAIGDIYKYNGAYILDEQMYKKGLFNSDIANFVLSLNEPQTLVIADRSDPQSTDELRVYGLNILPAQGVSKKTFGIGIVSEQKISVTKRSLNIIKEYRNYLYMKDKNGIVTNEPSPMFDHHMDGIRYAFQSLQDIIGGTAIKAQSERFDRNERIDLNNTR